MRPCGGFTPDMINFGHSTNVYKIWADMIAFDKSTVQSGDDKFCAYAGLRDGKNFVMTHEDIIKNYREHLKMVERIPDALFGAMDNQMYVAVFDTEKEMNNFYNHVLECKKTPKRRRKTNNPLKQRQHKRALPEDSFLSASSFIHSSKLVHNIQPPVLRPAILFHIKNASR